jgi:hypothetical protein
MDKMNKKVMRFNEWLDENELVDQGLAGAGGEQTQTAEIPGAEAVAAAAPREEIPGGLASGKTAADVASKHNVSVEEVNVQLERGKKVELEHTDDEKVACEIALDHLMEDPKYYDKLAAIEDEPKEPADEIKGKKAENTEE